ncbi:MAG: hypothetical protein ABF334_01630 [Akkermansiaceae bacterium]
MKYLLLSLIAISTAFGQTDHFSDIKWKERDSDHFMMRAYKTNHDPPRKYGKRVWKEMTEILPSLIEDFEKGGFRTPNGAIASKDEKSFKFTVYLMADGETYHKCLRKDAQRYNWDLDRQNLLKRTGNYRDPRNRYLVICKVDALSSGGGQEREKIPLFVHSTASTFLCSQARKSSLPLWMGAGMGYYVENEIFKQCQVLYLDFKKYYASEDGRADAIEGGTLGPEDSWARAVRKLCKKGKRISLNGVLNTKVTTLTPNESGYIFALTSFLLSDDLKKKKYREFVTAIRNLKPNQKGELEITEDLLLDTYNYEDVDTFETEWYAYLESTKFK